MKGLRRGSGTAAKPSSGREHRVAVWVLIVIASLLTVVGALTIWVKKEALDSDRVAGSTADMLADPAVRAALSTFLVDQLYKNVDVQAEIANTLPKNLKGFSGPASAVLHDYAVRTANTLLGSKATIRLVENATRTAHQQFISLVDDDPGHAQNVYLNLRSVLLSLAERVGLEDTVAQKLPPTAG